MPRPSFGVCARLAARVVVLGLFALAPADAQAQTAEPRWFDRFGDAEDGYVDLSDHLLKYRGVLPVPIGSSTSRRPIST